MPKATKYCYIMNCSENNNLLMEYFLNSFRKNPFLNRNSVFLAYSYGNNIFKQN